MYINLSRTDSKENYREMFFIRCRCTLWRNLEIFLFPTTYVVRDGRLCFQSVHTRGVPMMGVHPIQGWGTPSQGRYPLARVGSLLARIGTPSQCRLPLSQGRYPHQSRYHSQDRYPPPDRAADGVLDTPWSVYPLVFTQKDLLVLTLMSNRGKYSPHVLTFLTRIKVQLENKQWT